MFEGIIRFVTVVLCDNGISIFSFFSFFSFFEVDVEDDFIINFLFVYFLFGLSFSGFVFFSFGSLFFSFGSLFLLLFFFSEVVDEDDWIINFFFDLGIYIYF